MARDFGQHSPAGEPVGHYDSKLQPPPIITNPTTSSMIGRNAERGLGSGFESVMAQ